MGPTGVLAEDPCPLSLPEIVTIAHISNRGQRIYTYIYIYICRNCLRLCLQRYRGMGLGLCSKSHQKSIPQAHVLHIMISSLNLPYINGRTCFGLFGALGQEPPPPASRGCLASPERTWPTSCLRACHSPGRTRYLQAVIHKGLGSAVTEFNLSYYILDI